MAPTPPSRADKRRKRLVRAVVAGAVGILLGQLCGYLPEKARPICHYASKVVGFLAGSP